MASKISQTLQADKVIKTLQKLQLRISERFPGSGFFHVCTDLLVTAENTAHRARAARRPHFVLRALAIITVLCVVLLSVIATMNLGPIQILKPDKSSIIDLAQALDAAANLVILAGAALWFLLNLETRQKRRQILTHLHELRSLAHVIDMHQLTKDPVSLTDVAQPTENSPERTMTPYQLARYLDYCAEMLALTGKLAALYGEASADTEVIGAVNEIESLTTDMGRKVWQKIVLIDA